jgi:predicted lipoprotein
LAKQAEYVKEMTTIDSNRAKIQSWRLEQVVDEYNLTIEVRVYDSSSKLKAMMSALCKAGSDLETAKKIFMTIQFH